MPPCEQYLILCTLLLFLCHKSLAIECYQCSGTGSKHPFECNEWLSSDIDMEPISCNWVYGAKYCIKHVGRFEGIPSGMTLTNACCINCYQCSSSKTLDCSDGMIQMSEMEPKNCDHVFEAAYCIKSTSLAGGIGTKRYCSSLDLGNYCNYVKQPGDILTYRTCVFTCSGNGCNPGRTNSPTHFLLSLMMTIALVVYFGR